MTKRLSIGDLKSITKGLVMSSDGLEPVIYVVLLMCASVDGYSWVQAFFVFRLMTFVTMS